MPVSGRDPPVELAVIDWTFCDGLASAEIVGDTLRVVLYVTDTGTGLPPQDRVAVKVIMPLAAVREALALVAAALEGRGPLAAGIVVN